MANGTEWRWHMAQALAAKKKAEREAKRTDKEAKRKQIEYEYETKRQAKLARDVEQAKVHVEQATPLSAIKINLPIVAAVPLGSPSCVVPPIPCGFGAD